MQLFCHDARVSHQFHHHRLNISRKCGATKGWRYLILNTTHRTYHIKPTDILQVNTILIPSELHIWEKHALQKDQENTKNVTHCSPSTRVLAFVSLNQILFTPALIPVQWCMEAWDCQVSAAMIIKWIDLRGTFYNCAKLISTWHVLHLVFLPPEASWTEYISPFQIFTQILGGLCWQWNVANSETRETWQIRDVCT